jgi:hypothetical protein
VDTTLFDFAAERIEHYTGFSRIEARGTLRIALKVAGLDAGTLTAGQLCVVLEKVMPAELKKRGVKEFAETCGAVMDDLANVPAAPAEAGAGDLDGIFRRLGGD